MKPHCAHWFIRLQISEQPNTLGLVNEPWLDNETPK